MRKYLLSLGVACFVTLIGVGTANACQTAELNPSRPPTMAETGSSTASAQLLARWQGALPQLAIPCIETFGHSPKGKCGTNSGCELKPEPSTETRHRIRAADKPKGKCDGTCNYKPDSVETPDSSNVVHASNTARPKPKCETSCNFKPDSSDSTTV